MKTIALTIFLLLPIFLFSQNSPPDTIRQHWHSGRAVEPSRNDNLLKIRVFDFSMQLIPGLQVCATQLESGQVWQGETGEKGQVYFLVPKGKGYRIDAGDEQGLKTVRLPPQGKVRSSYSVTYVAKEYSERERNDTIFQKVSPAQAPTRQRVLAKVNVKGYDEEPLDGEVLYFSTKKSAKVYVGTADEKGYLTLMLPKGDTFCLSTSYVADVDCFELPQNGFAERLTLTFQTIGTKEFLRRKAERERQAAIRDSLYRVQRALDSLRMISDSLRNHWEEKNFIHQLEFGKDPLEVEKLIKKRAAKERKLIAEDSRYFEKSGEEVKAVLYRMRSNWTNKVIVTDITGSMYPYMDQVLLWHALQLSQGENNRYLFFNDGDNEPDNHQALGHAGGIYHTDAKAMQELMAKMSEGIQAGGGGHSSENDLEALLAAEEKLRELDELILIADNYSDVWDIELLAQLDVPVHVILAGAEHGVNEQYLEIAYRTQGSVHTLSQDIENLAQLADGQIVTIGSYRYRVSKGKFVQISGM